MNTLFYKDSRKFLSPRRGQAIVEFGLIAIMLIFLTMGIIQYGVVLNATVSLNHLSREGARFAAVQATSMDEASLQRRVNEYLRRVAPPALNIPKTPEADSQNMLVSNVILPPGGPQRGQPIEVAMSYNMRPKMFMPVFHKYLFPNFRESGNGRYYDTRGTMVIEATT